MRIGEIVCASLFNLACLVSVEAGVEGPGPSGPKVFLAGAAVVDVSPRTLPVIVNGGFLEASADTIQDPLSARGLVLDDGAAVSVGADARIGHDVRLLTVTLPLDAGQRRDGWRVARPVTIGADAWLGDGVTVLPGVTVGAGTVVGAGSVVTRDLPAGVLAVGNPAAVIRQLGDA